MRLNINDVLRIRFRADIPKCPLWCDSEVDAYRLHQWVKDIDTGDLIKDEELMVQRMREFLRGALTRQADTLAHSIAKWYVRGEKP